MPTTKRTRSTRSPARPTPGTRARHREAQRRKDRRQLVSRLAFALVVLLLAGFALFRAARSPDQSGSASPTTTAAGGCVADTKVDPGDGVAGDAQVYRVNPPAGGPYASDSAAPGFYADRKPVPTDAKLVRAMRRGFVVLWYRTDLSDAQFEVIGSLSDQIGRDMILVPRRSLGGPIALTAWHNRLLCQGVDPQSVLSFVKDHRDKGPEKGFL